MKYHVSNTDNPVDFPEPNKFREFERASGIEIYGLGKDRVKWEAALERYRELIVEEACQAFWSEACHVSDLAYEEYQRSSKKIKEHFGLV
jgi:hypothetical protein